MFKVLLLLGMKVKSLGMDRPFGLVIRDSTTPWRRGAWTSCCCVDGISQSLQVRGVDDIRDTTKTGRGLLYFVWEGARVGVMRTDVNDTIRRRIPGNLGLVVQFNPSHLKVRETSVAGLGMSLNSTFPFIYLLCFFRANDPSTNSFWPHKPTRTRINQNPEDSTSRRPSKSWTEAPTYCTSDIAIL